MIVRIRQIFSRWLGPCDGKGRLLWWICVLLALGFGWYLIGAENEWSERIQRRIAEGKKLKAREYGVIGLWRGALAGLVATLGILATVRWWGKGRPGGIAAERAGGIFSDTGFKGARWLLLAGLLGAVVLGGILRVPRLGHSLWNDEEYAVRRYVWGQWEIGKEGRPEFDENDWEEALFFNHGNNHFFHTVTARMAMGAWQQSSGSGVESFSEAPTRIVPLIASLGTIAAVGVLGWACGLPMAGVAAAFLTALSPWHIRYSVEARGYSSMLFFLMLALLALLLAVRTGRWRWWFLFGASQCLVLLCYLGAIYAIAVMNVGILIYLWLGGERRRWMVSRWLMASALTALPFVLLMFPSIPQVAAYLERNDLPKIPMDFAWIREVWTHLVGGIPWGNQSISVDGSPLFEGELGRRHLGIDVISEAELRPWVMPVFSVVAPLFFAIGFVALLVKNWKTRMVAAVLGVSGVLLYAHNYWSHNPTHAWYLIQLVPLFALAMPAGIEVALRGKWRPMGAVGMAALVVGYGLVSWPAARLLGETDRQPIRQTTKLIERTAAPENPLTGVFGTSARQVLTYDWDVKFLEVAEDVDALIEEGQKSGRPVFVYFCGDGSSWRVNPEVAERVGGDPRFRTVGLVKGLEAMYSYRVLRFER